MSEAQLAKHRHEENIWAIVSSANWTSGEFSITSCTQLSLYKNNKTIQKDTVEYAGSSTSHTHTITNLQHNHSLNISSLDIRQKYITSFKIMKIS